MSTTLPTRSANGGAADQAAPPSWGGLAVLLAGVFIVTLDFFIVNVAIPSVQQDFAAGPDAVQFVVAGFGLAYAAGLVPGGRLGDLFGRRRVYAIGLALFTLASLACGLAPGAGFLVAARVVQGLSAALLTPQVLAIINVVHTGRHRARAFSAFGLAIGFGGVFGQFIGGLLIHADVAGAGWRMIFLINVPVGVAVLAVLRRLVPETKSADRARLDVPGSVLIG
ncbi:MFS transporter, partial [Actinosynnema sp. NPDC023658]|uniref:MFS transporter n=1 Tax=Actinosynnema sp. NPDC023658 TaxID=3155465 RepID=UPI0033F9F40D